MKRSLIFLSLLLCSTQIMAQTQTLGDFIREQFAIGRDMSFQDRRLAEQLFWIEAPFDQGDLTEVNRLRDDLSHYCFTQGGNLTAEGYFKGNLVKSAFPKVDRDAALRVVTHLESMELFPMDPSDEDRAASLPHAIQEIFFQKTSEMHRSMVDRRMDFEAPACDEKGAAAAYAEAVETGSFGHFACENPRDETIKWEVLIQPVAIQGKTCAKEESKHTLFMRVIPYKKGE